MLGDRPIAVARELTKLHEEIVRGSISEARAHFQQHEPRGEFTLVVGGSGGPGSEPTGPWSEEQLLEALREGLAAGQPQSQLASEVAGKSGWQRREVYRKISGLKDEGGLS